MKITKTGISVLICAISLIIIIPLLVFLYFFNADSEAGLPNIKNESSEDKTVIPGDDDKIYDSIRGNVHDTVGIIPDINHDTVKEMLANVKAPDAFCWYYDSTVYSSKKSSTASGILKLDSNNYKIELYSADGTLSKTVIGESESVTVQNNIHGTLSEFAAESADMFAEAGVPDISMFSNDTGTDFEYSLVTSEYGTLLYAEFETAKDGYSQSEQYYISLDYGIVIRADCYENENIVYSLSTTALYEL